MGNKTVGNSTPPPVKLKQPEVIFDQETGKMTGVKMPDGRTFLGISPNDIRGLVGKATQDTSLPAGALPAGTQQAQQDTTQQIQRLTQLAQQGLLTPQEMQAIQGASPDIGQALGAGGIGVIPGAAGGLATGIGAGILGGAISGAAAGSVVPGIGTVILGAAGALTGFLIAVKGNIKKQQTEQFAADTLALTKGNTFLRSLITDTNQNPQNAPDNIALFYKTLNMIDAAHVKTYRDSQENLNKFLGEDGTVQLARFETFNSTLRAYYINRFNIALNNPDPNQVLLGSEDLGMEIE